MNTRIDFLYRDGSNYKFRQTAIVAGAFSDEHVKKIMDSLDGEEYFIPGQVGLPCSYAAPYAENEDDHPWCELGKEDFSLTEEEPTINVDIDTLVARFAAYAGKWDEDGAFLDNPWRRPQKDHILVNVTTHKYVHTEKGRLACKRNTYNFCVKLQDGETVSDSEDALKILRRRAQSYLTTADGWKTIRQASYDFSWDDFAKEVPLHEEIGVTLTDCANAEDEAVYTADVRRDELLAPWMVPAKLVLYNEDGKQTAEAAVIADFTDGTITYSQNDISESDFELMADKAAKIELIVAKNGAAFSVENNDWGFLIKEAESET